MEERVVIDDNAENNINTSGQGKNAIVPDEVANHFNWGAFLLNCLWGLGNNSYLTLLVLATSFIPLLNMVAPLVLCVWFGVEGNKWAWKNKRFQSIEHFHSYQKKWATAGAILFLLGVVISIVILALTIPVLMNNTSDLQNETMMKKEKNTLKEVVLMNEALEKKCDNLSSEGLAKCFAERMNVVKNYSNIIEAADGSVWEFTGDGYCDDDDACSVKITVKSGDQSDSEEMSLYVNDKGYLYIEED